MGILQDILRIKEEAKYRDIDWLMPGVDVPSVLKKLGLSVETSRGNQINSYCPDHHLFTGRKPSHPFWTVNIVTGETMCFTEGRGSNLLYVVCRLLKIPAREGIKFLTGVEGDTDFGILEMNALKAKLSSLKSREVLEVPKIAGLDEIQRDVEKHNMAPSAYRFFIHPPGKQNPTNIQKETVDHYKVFERTWGFYAQRVIIPFYLRGELVGFCAIDLLGQKEWLRRHPDKKEGEYRKTRYPLNMLTGKFLFGFDDCEKNADDLILVEGPREKMKLWQEGYPNSVAIMGAFLSDDQYQLISELNPKRVSLMFDGDDAGATITDRVANKLSRNFNVFKCVVPRGKDPKNLAHDDFEMLLKEK